MTITLRGRIRNGRIDADEVDLPDGQEVLVTVEPVPVERAGNGGGNVSLRGIWRGLEITEEEIEAAKRIWSEGAERQARMLDEA